MDPEFSRLVEEAASVASSGRWNAVNEQIKLLVSNPGQDNGWWVQVLASLCAQLFSEYLSLKREYEENRDEAVIAWRARNLLELSVWCLFCSKCRANARRLYEDAGRDMMGLFSAFTRWGTTTAQDPEWLNLFSGAKKELGQRAAAEGIPSLDESYKRVDEAAKDAGIGDHFALSNRMLSKFVHPTAMMILAPPDEERAALQRDCFFSQGCLFFAGAFAALESQLLQVSA